MCFHLWKTICADSKDSDVRVYFVSRQGDLMFMEERVLLLPLILSNCSIKPNSFPRIWWKISISSPMNTTIYFNWDQNEAESPSINWRKEQDKLRYLVRVVIKRTLPHKCSKTRHHNYPLNGKIVLQRQIKGVTAVSSEISPSFFSKIHPIRSPADWHLETTTPIDAQKQFWFSKSRKIKADDDAACFIDLFDNCVAALSAHTPIQILFQ